MFGPSILSYDDYGSRDVNFRSTVLSIRELLTSRYVLYLNNRDGLSVSKVIEGNGR